MYKLNHVQTTLRNKLDDEIHENKVHPSGERLVHNNLARENESDENHKESNCIAGDYHEVKIIRKVKSENRI